MTIIIADDHFALRTGLKTLLASVPDKKVIGEAGSLKELKDLLESLPCDCVLLDITFKGESSLSVLKQLTQDYPGTAFLVLSMHEEGNYVLRALQNGAQGYITKESAGNVLFQALEALEKGVPYLDAVSLKNLVQGIKNLPVDFNHFSPATAPLSPREREILNLLLEGETSKSIARTLMLSIKTVDNHRSAIYEKLKVESMGELFKFARDQGLWEEKLP